MDKDSQKNKYKKPCKVEDLYNQYKKETKKHAEQIVKMQHQEVTYYTSYAKKWKLLGDNCTLILFQKGGSYMFGYCRQTKGFPFVQNVEPYTQCILALGEVKTLQLTEKGIEIEATEIFKHKNTNYDWKFVFQTNQLKQKWFFLIVQLWYCSKNQLKPNIDLIINEKPNSDLTKQETNQNREILVGNKPVKLEQRLQSLTYTKFLLLHQEIRELKNKQKQYEQTISKLQKKLSIYTQIKEENQLKELNLQMKLNFLNMLNPLSSQQVSQLNRLSQEQNQEVQTLKRKIDQLIKDKQKETQSKLAALQEMQLFDIQLRIAVKKEKIYLQEIEPLNKIAQTKHNQYRQLRNSQQNIRVNLQTSQHSLNQERAKNKVIVQENNKLGNEKNKLENEKNNLLQQIEILKIDLKELRNSVQKYQKELGKSNQNDQIKSKQIQQLKTKLQQGVRKYKKTEQSLKKERDKSHKHKKDAEEKEVQLYQLQGKYTRLEGQFDDFKQQSQTQKNILEDQVNQIKDLNKIYRKESESQKMQLSQKFNHITGQSLKLKDQNQRLSNQIQRLIIQTKKVAAMMKQLEITPDTALQKFNKTKLLHIFQGDILENHQYYKEFMKEQIEAYRKKKIRKTKKLYTLEKEVKSDFHRYADDVPQIAVIVQTDSGFYLAGYSQSPISTKTIANKGGLIMSLNNRRSFPVIPGKKSVSYDTFFLIIGNSEIRLKNQEWKVFSNFGIANSFYDSYGCGVDELLGQGPTVRYVKIITFEIHQIIYE